VPRSMKKKSSRPDRIGNPKKKEEKVFDYRLEKSEVPLRLFIKFPPREAFNVKDRGSLARGSPAEETVSNFQKGRGRSGKDKEG